MIQNRSIRFFAVEKLTFIYILITSMIILFLKPELGVVTELLRVRVLMVLAIIVLAYINSIKNWWVIRFSRCFCWCPFGILVSWNIWYKPDDPQLWSFTGWPGTKLIWLSTGTCVYPALSTTLVRRNPESGLFILLSLDYCYLHVLLFKKQAVVWAILFYCAFFILQLLPHLYSFSYSRSTVLLSGYRTWSGEFRSFPEYRFLFWQTSGIVVDRQ